MKIKAAVIGHPISHSLSPTLFRILSRYFKKDLDYHALDIEPDQLKNKIKELQKEYVGLNVTVPLKEAVLNFGK